MQLIDRLFRRWLSSRGYQVLKPREQAIPDNVPDPGNYTLSEDAFRYLRPWKSPNFQRHLTPAVTDNTMLTVIKLYTLHAFARRAASQPGDFLEAGVHNGGSARLLLDVLRAQHAPNKLWLLDTFSGYSPPTPGRDAAQSSEGDCRGLSRAHVEKLLADGADQIRIVEGAIPGTLAQVDTRALAFAHIDVNLYEPTLTATEFCLERMLPGGVILFDDYGWPATYGARTAIDAACEKYSQVVISVPESSQAFLVKS